MACALFAVIFSPGLHTKQGTLPANSYCISYHIVSSLFDIVFRSLSLKCFVSKFLLKVPFFDLNLGSNMSVIHLQLQNDSVFQQHLHVSDELRRHLEENAAGQVFTAVATNDAEPLQSSPPADSPIAPSCVTSRSLEASGTYMTPLRCTRA
jgi:hypothetical protein